MISSATAQTLAVKELRLDDGNSTKIDRWLAATGTSPTL